MTMQNATELANDNIQVDGDETHDGTATGSRTPVADAFGAGVLGGELPNVPIPPEPVEPDPTPHRQEAAPIDLSREATLQLDKARGFAAEIAKIKTDTADRLLEVADPLLDAIDMVMSRIDVTKLDVERAIAEAVGPLKTLPHLDEETRKKVITAATEKARADLFAVRGKELEALAVQVVEAAERMEAQLEFESTFSDDELRTALDGERRPEERASEDYLVSRLSSETTSEIEKTWELLNLDPDMDRRKRYERAALKVLDGILAKSNAELTPGGKTSDNTWTAAETKKAEARKLRERIRAAQATRSPKSIGHAKALLANIKIAWQRIAGFDVRRGAGAVTADQMTAQRNDDSKRAQARAQARSWKPLENWHGRHFRKAK